ncbi:exopolysaccharide biosynthesis polyprenyl glycosylphosphotransferase [Lachnospiraceae bacterium PM6-15]|uniref:sugar transferase n=2 Tax=Ohessyouella blattaphilus TaxID=2949333 RepID=UPI003E2445B6
MYQRNSGSAWVKHLDFLILDIVCLEASLLIAYFIRYGGKLTLPKNYEVLALLLVLVDVAVVFSKNSYTGILRRDKTQEFESAVSHCTFVLLFLIIIFFALKISVDFSRIVIAVMYIASIILITCLRAIWKRVIRNYVNTKKDLAKVLVVGHLEEIEQDIKGIDKPYAGYKIVGAVVLDDDSLVGDFILGVPVVATKASMYRYASKNIIDMVFLHDMSLEEPDYVEGFIRIGVIVCERIIKKTVSKYNPQVNTLGDLPIISGCIKPVSDSEMFVKRAMDIGGGLVGVVIMAMFFAIFAPIIYLQSPGPIFFKQKRVGRNGRPFNVYKFRSMYPDAEERKKELMAKNTMKGPMFKLDKDPRIIPIGHFLRKSSIDEFPQFINVLKGDMSMVGTRPPTMEEYEQYLPHHRQRLAMRPGITGLWQVSGRSDIKDFDEVVALDTKYIANWNIWLDIRIIWKTIQVVFNGKGAA